MAIQLDPNVTAHIANVAERVAPAVASEASVLVALTPGDGSVYHLLVTNAALVDKYRTDDRQGWFTDGLIVTLLNSDGRSWPWNGGYTTADYAQEKWATTPYVSTVIAVFLTALGTVLNSTVA